MQEISFGQYALPVILMVGLAFFYKLFDKADGTSYISDRAKPLIAIGLGIGLGIVGMYYNGIQPIFKNIVDHALYGFMAGASAIGLWEGFSAVKSKSNGAAKAVKMILAIFLIPAMLIGGMSGCATIGTSGKPILTEDEQARLIVGGFQDASGILFDAGKIFIAAQPQYSGEWRAIVVPSFGEFNKMLLAIETSGSQGQKITPQLVLAQLQTQIIDITSAFTNWGTVPAGTGGKMSPQQTALLITSGLGAGFVLYDQLMNLSGGKILGWDVIIARNGLLQAKIEASK